MLLNGACTGSDVRAGSLHSFCGGDFLACLSRFLGLGSQGVWSLWKHMMPLFPVVRQSWNESGEREAGQGTAVGWVLRLVPVNRERKQDKVFSWASVKAIEIFSCGNLHQRENSSLMAQPESVLWRIIFSIPFSIPLKGASLASWSQKCPSLWVH